MATATAAAASPAKTKPKCKYWGKCYRTEPSHLKNYSHPPNESLNGDQPKTKVEDIDLEVCVQFQSCKCKCTCTIMCAFVVNMLMHDCNYVYV